MEKNLNIKMESIILNENLNFSLKLILIEVCIF